MQLGYSLIELLVVLGIMGLLTAYGVAAYNGMNDRYKVEQATLELVSTLRDWQKQVDAGVGSTVCATNVYQGRNVTYATTPPLGPRLESRIVCSGIPSDTEMKNYILLHSTTLTNFTAFQFLPLGDGVNTAQQFQVSAGAISYQVTIRAGGGISAQRL